MSDIVHLSQRWVDPSENMKIVSSRGDFFRLSAAMGPLEKSSTVFKIPFFGAHPYMAMGCSTDVYFFELCKSTKSIYQCGIV